jgi:hypothetical protein
MVFRGEKNLVFEGTKNLNIYSSWQDFLSKYASANEYVSPDEPNL